jgi:DNA-binding NarL/FixJ family response regulator
MSGVEVLKWIRAQSVVRKTRVLIFTSSEKPEDFRAANEIGADGYLLKPTKFDDLKKLVKQIHEEWLGKKKAAKQGGRREKNELDSGSGAGREEATAENAVGTVASI